jgi:hypothetical protein
VYHLAAYFVALGTTVDTDVPALTDDILTIQNNHFVLQQQMNLIAAAAMSATLTRAKLASPTMRQIASPYIRPVIGAVQPPNNPNMWLLDSNPFSIPPFEEIQNQATSGIAMGTENYTALIWLTQQMEPIVYGNAIPLRITSTGTAVTNAWTSIPITFQDTLPSGVYAMLFSEHFSTNAIAHRWIFSNQIPRPGQLSLASQSSRLPNAVSKGQFGIMGRFRSNDLPRFQVLCNGADAVHTIFAQVVRVGNL